MNKMMTTSLALLGVLAVAGCGESGLGVTDLGGGDMTANAEDMRSPDLAVPPDMTYTQRMDGGPVLCGAMTCSGSDKCCIDTRLDGGAGTATCAATCGSGTISVACRGPSQCGGNPCCVALQGTSIGNITCTNSQTACVPMFDFGSFTGMTRLCEFDADCTAGAPSTQLNKCCQISAMGQMQKLCLSTLIAANIPGGATCN